MGKRQSGAAWRVDVPLLGGGPEGTLGAPFGWALGGPDPHRIELRGALEVEADRQMSLFASTEEGAPAEGTEGPLEGGAPRKGLMGALRRRAVALFKQGRALGGPSVLSVSEVSAHPKAPGVPIGHDTAKATVSLAAIRRQAADPRFLGTVSQAPLLGPPCCLEGPPRSFRGGFCCA